MVRISKWIDEKRFKRDVRMSIISRIASRIAGDSAPVLTLVVGLPGSGKSTFAKGVPNASHYEADMFFVDKDGNYNFDRTRLKQAHEWCQRMTARDLMNGKSVVVSNTGLQIWERETYYKIAQRCGAKIRVKVMTGNYGNIHNVPEEALEMMKRRFQPVGRDEVMKYGVELI